MPYTLAGDVKGVQARTMAIFCAILLALAVVLSWRMAITSEERELRYLATSLGNHVPDGDDARIDELPGVIGNILGIFRGRYTAGLHFAVSDELVGRTWLGDPIDGHMAMDPTVVRRLTAGSPDPVHSLYWSPKRGSFILECDVPLAKDGRTMGYAFANVPIMHLVAVTGRTVAGVVSITLVAWFVASLLTMRLVRRLHDNIERMTAIVGDGGDARFDYAEFQSVADGLRKAYADLRNRDSYRNEILANFPWGYAVADSAGNCVEMNGNGNAILGLPDGWTGSVPFGLADAGSPLGLALSGRERIDMDVGISDDGCQRTLRCTAFPTILTDGEPGATMWFVDVTDTLNTEKALMVVEYRMAELEAVLNALQDGVIVYDMTGAITRMNRSAELILGYPEALRRAPMRERLAESRLETDEGLPIPLEGNLVYRAVNGEDVGRMLLRHSHAGNSRWLNIGAAPIRLSDGRQIGAVASFFDCTELRKLYDTTQKLSRIKDDFLAMCSHEMRTPLTVIQAGFELLIGMYDRLEPARREAHMRAIHNNVKKLNTLVTDLLDFSRLETGHLSMNMVPMDIDALLSEAVGNFAKGCSTHAISYHRGFSGCVTVYGDGQRLEQVMNNLLTNAVRYSATGTAITVSSGFEGFRMTVSVADEGRGIPADQIPHLFDRYYRGTYHDRAQTGGMGLGLYIASEIMRLHEGSISVESEVGIGSVFTVSLPAMVCGAEYVG